jgi:hypothetical protein
MMGTDLLTHSHDRELASRLPGYPATWGPGGSAGHYRYTLWRVVRRPIRSFVHVCGLNPSTATEHVNDPTIKRLISFVEAWNHDAFCMTNAFAFRATQPADMKAASDPIGPDNDAWLSKIAGLADLRVACWGAHGVHLARDVDVYRIMRAAGPVHCLGLTQGAQPKHPLYLSGATTPELWEREP